MTPVQTSGKGELRSFLSKALEPSLPISRLPVPMGDGENLDDRLLLPVNDRERKALQNESPSSALASRPASRRRDHKFDGAIYFGNKVGGCGFVPLQVPNHGRFPLL